MSKPFFTEEDFNELSQTTQRYPGDGRIARAKAEQIANAKVAPLQKSHDFLEVELKKVREENERLTMELEENARLHGKGSSREAAQLTRIAKLEEALRDVPGRLELQRLDLVREAEEMECLGEECEAHCALMDVEANIRLIIGKARAALEKK